MTKQSFSIEIYCLKPPRIQCFNHLTSFPKYLEGMKRRNIEILSLIIPCIMYIFKLPRAIRSYYVYAFYSKQIKIRLNARHIQENLTDV